MSACLLRIMTLAFCCALPLTAGKPIEKTTHLIKKVDTGVVIDGQIDEATWRDALKLELSYEVRPAENQQPPVKTEIFLAFTDKALLVAFKCYDPNPAKIRARFNGRDSSWNDDFVGIVLDTFNDERRAYELMVNPLGVQIDAINDDAGGNYDDSWNAIWDSAGKITDEGYEVEMRIPFNQLRFQPSEQGQTWGFDAIRSYPREDRHHIGLFPRDRNTSDYLTQTEKVQGFEGADPGRNIEIVPTVVSGRTDSYDSDIGGLVNGEEDSEAGLTARWGVTPNITLNGTVNPDFSQVEADSVQLNINNTFANFFPETRPFFLEGADFFSTPFRLVHTRSIVDPTSALKTTGKVGSHTFGAFVAEDEINNILIPGAQRSSGNSFDQNVVNTVARYRYDIGRGSTIGGLVTNREGQNGYQNTVISLDARYRFNDTDSLRFNAVRSQTDYSEEMRTTFREDNDVDLGNETLEDDGYRINLNRNARNYYLRAFHVEMGDDFRADTGFMTRVGYSTTVIGAGRIWHGTDKTFFNRINWGGDWDVTKTSDGGLIERELETWLDLSLPFQTGLNFNVGGRDRVFEGARFDQRYFSVRGDTTLSRNLSVWGSINGGDGIDFTHVREADRVRWDVGGRYNLGKRLRLRMSYNTQQLDVEGGNLFETAVIESRIDYHFNRRTQVRAILQDTTIDRNVLLYDANLDADPDNDVDASTEDFFAQLLFSYKLNPQTVAFVGYTDAYFANDEIVDLTQQQRTLFVKLGYAWTR